MTSRVLGTELRRSAAPWTAIVITLAGAAMLYPVLRGWGGRWTLLAMQQREYLFVLWPLALGAGAWQGRRESRSRVRELFATTPRPVWQRVAPIAAAMAIAVVLGYLGMFAAGAVQVLFTASYFPMDVVPTVAIGALSMVAAAWLGLAFGTFVPFSSAAPALALTGLFVAVWIFMSDTGAASALVSPVLLDEFSTLTGRVHLSQALWFTALAVTAFGLLAATKHWSRVASTLPALLGLLVAVTVLPSHRTAFAVPDPRARALVCTPDAPKVCVTAVHSAALTDVISPARRALAILAAKLPEAPISVVESATRWNVADSTPPAPDELLVRLDVTATGRARLTEHDLVWTLLEGAGTSWCANVSEDATRRQPVAREIAAGWLLDQEPPREVLSIALRDDELVSRTWQVFRTLPFDEQQARVQALRTSALGCDGQDLLTLLVTGHARK